MDEADEPSTDEAETTDEAQTTAMPSLAESDAGPATVESPVPGAPTAEAEVSDSEDDEASASRPGD